MIIQDKKIVYVVPACNAALRLGKEKFASNLRQIKEQLRSTHYPQQLLVVNNSFPSDRGMTGQTALQEKAVVLEIPPISAGYARFHGLNHAFNNLSANFSFLGDDDLYVLPQAVFGYLKELENGADLVLGERSFWDFIRHPLWQCFLEGAANFYITQYLKDGALDKRKECHSPFYVDFLSGGQAFSKKGWQQFSHVVSEEKIKQLGTACAFFPGIFKKLGLGMKTVKVLAPYDGSYWKDSFTFTLMRKRIKTILMDIKDAEAAKKTNLFHGRGRGKNRGVSSN